MLCFLHIVQLPFIPPNVQEINFRLNVSAGFWGNYILRHYRVDATEMEFNYTISVLTINTTYTLSISAEGRYQWCSYNGVEGDYSELITIATAERGDILTCSYIVYSHVLAYNYILSSSTIHSTYTITASKS